MGRAHSKGERKRIKQAQAAFAAAGDGSDPIKRPRGRPKKEGVEREPGTGRPSRKGTQVYKPKPLTPEQQAANRRTVMEQRCKAMGWEVNEANCDLARSDYLGCNAGRALHDLDKQNRDELWEIVQRIRSTYARYWSIHGLPSPFAKGASMAVVPEGFGSDGVEIDVSPSEYDDRTIEEKSRASTNAMMSIDGALTVAGRARELKEILLLDYPVTDRPHFVRAMLGVEAHLRGEEKRNRQKK